MTHKKISIPEDYAVRIFAIRRRLRLTQEQFGDHIDVTMDCVDGWETGQNRPSRTAWSRINRLVDSLQPPHEDAMFKIIPDWQEKPIRVNLPHIASYRQARRSDMSGQKTAYELFEYTVLFMAGGHTHIVHMCEAEFDNIFAADARYYR